jgi:hypothetical protein
MEFKGPDAIESCRLREMKWEERPYMEQVLFLAVYNTAPGCPGTEISIDGLDRIVSPASRLVDPLFEVRT